jgi:histidine triad (HIT) family protein
MPDERRECVFCRIAAGELPSTRVQEDERTIAFMDINPSTRGHVLVIPRRHSTDIHDIDPDDLAACFQAAKAIAARELESLGADGFNLLHSTGRVAGQTVPHFHVHVIPRYAGDGIRDPLHHAAGDRAEIEAAAAALRA